MAGNFRANIGGKPILVTSANYDSAPRRIVILIDAGESMTGSLGDSALTLRSPPLQPPFPARFA